MDMTITLRDAGLILIGIGLIILIAYCIAFMKNLIVTVKHTNKILEDAQVVSKIAAEKTKEAEKIIGDVVTSFGSVSNIIKGNQSVVAAFTSIVNALASLRNLIKKTEKK